MGIRPTYIELVERAIKEYPESRFTSAELAIRIRSKRGQMLMSPIKISGIIHAHGMADNAGTVNKRHGDGGFVAVVWEKREADSK